MAHIIIFIIIIIFFLSFLHVHDPSVKVNSSLWSSGFDESLETETKASVFCLSEITSQS